MVQLSKFFPEDQREIHGAVHAGELLPYLSREEIDGKGLLRNRGLELAWVDDPVALFFLHIQGSGSSGPLDGGGMRVNYAGSNGLPYASVARYMIDNGIVGSGSNAAIQDFLARTPQRRDEILFRNRRYIFFRSVDLADREGPIGSLGVPLVAGRSIATDQRYVPPGALMYIKARRPDVDAAGHVGGWREMGRFAFSHDTGAAIKGPGRGDIFWGAGERAGTTAGYLNERGDMTILVCGVAAAPDDTNRQPGCRVRSSALGRRAARGGPPVASASFATLPPAPRAASPRRIAAVHRHDRARHVGGRRRGEKQARRPDLLRATHAIHADNPRPSDRRCSAFRDFPLSSRSETTPARSR